MQCTFNEQELRIEDYEAGRKTGASGSTGFTGLSTSTSTGGLFGTTSGTGFGASASLIGQNQPLDLGQQVWVGVMPHHLNSVSFGAELQL